MALLDALVQVHTTLGEMEAPATLLEVVVQATLYKVMAQATLLEVMAQAILIEDPLMWAILVVATLTVEAQQVRGLSSLEELVFHLFPSTLCWPHLETRGWQSQQLHSQGGQHQGGGEG